MKSLFIEEKSVYDGSQLRSLFAYMEHGLQGDSIVSWVGPCLIPRENIVDGEDLRAGASICGDEMVHFLIEKFHSSLLAAVALQRLFASLCIEVLANSTDPSVGGESKLRRKGDDIFFGGGKMSISVATVSPVSSLIHFAVNGTNKGTPVKTASLEDLKVKPQLFAQSAMAEFVAEMNSIEQAAVKVRWVK